MMHPKMPSFQDEEGKRVPDGLPRVIDAHVHVFPRGILSAIRKWFDRNAWRIRYRVTTAEVFDFLFSRGIRHIVALQYAHKPGIARALNAYMIEKCRPHGGRVLGMATVFPGEEGAETILKEAFDSGLGGLKLHAHVQCFQMDGDLMHPIYECCRKNNKPVVMHVGREPKSTAYKCDPYVICGAEKLEAVLRSFPDMKVCVPHLGFDETMAYRRLVETYDNLWLDTTMVLTDYFKLKEPIDLARYRSDRLMYGSDFPNIPYAWDRELKALESHRLPEEALQNITHRTAAGFFGITPH